MIRQQAPVFPCHTPGRGPEDRLKNLLTDGLVRFESENQRTETVGWKASILK